LEVSVLATRATTTADIHRTLWFEEWKAETDQKPNKYQFDKYVKSLNNTQIEVRGRTVSYLDACPCLTSYRIR
jgi:hypothetical protein